MNVSIYSLDGKPLRQFTLPEIFSEPYRDDLIKRAVLSDESKEYQPKGSYIWAGLNTSARYKGRKEDFGAVKNKGIAHLPHEVLPKGQLGKVKRVPHSVKGRRAHPPKKEKILIERINKIEYKKALKSALAASANSEQVKKRTGGLVSTSILIIENNFETLKKTKEVIPVFNALNLASLLEHCKKTSSKGPLVVVSNSSDFRACSNIPGVNAVNVNRLQVRHLAPGTHAGRVTLFTEKALEELTQFFKKGDN